MTILLLASTALVTVPGPKKQQQKPALRKNQPAKQQPVRKQQGKVLNDSEKTLNPWPQENERDQIMAFIASINEQAYRQEAAIREQFTAMGCGGGRSSAEASAINQLQANCQNAIIQYLRQLGTPVSYQVYKEMYENAG